jgi:glucose/arabinose dehydrogenase
MKIFTLILIGLFSAITNYSQPAIGFQNIASGLSVPVDIADAKDNSGRLFIVEQSGKIKIWNGSSVSSTPFLDISSIITYDGGERGLLSLAFHPDYSTNRYFFVWYNNLNGDVTLARYQTQSGNANVADAASGVVLMAISKPFTNHNGAKLNFGPDGYLYFGTGDGGNGGDPNNNAQTGTSYLGKLLRIDVNNFSTAPYYSIPSTNPYATDPNIKHEIIAFGLRNPWRWSFDKQTGDMWMSDVGQGAWEEVNYVAANNLLNKNYGWRCYEGSHVYTTCTPQTPANNVVPIFEYDHSSAGGYVITGGYVYRGTEYPFLQGYYMCIDYATANLWLIKSNGSGGWVTTKQTGLPTTISAFGENINGTLYAAGHDNGILYKITASSPLPLQLLSFTTKKNSNNYYELNWEVAEEKTGDIYIIERSFDNNSFIEIDNKQAITDKNYNKYSINTALQNGITYYRLKMVNTNGKIVYSSVISINNNNVTANITTYKSGGTLYIQSSINLRQISVIDVSGKELYKKAVTGSGVFSVPAQQLSKGLLVIRLVTDAGITTIKAFN